MRWVSSTAEEWSVLRVLVTTLWAPVELAVAFLIIVPFCNPLAEMAAIKIWGLVCWVLETGDAPRRWLAHQMRALKSLPEPPRLYSRLKGPHTRARKCSL